MAVSWSSCYQSDDNGASKNEKVHFEERIHLALIFVGMELVDEQIATDQVHKRATCERLQNRQCKGSLIFLLSYHSYNQPNRGSQDE